jgi:hypothetical protein
MWVVSNLVRGKTPVVNFKLVRPFIEPMIMTANGLVDTHSEVSCLTCDVVADCAWAFCYLAEIGESSIQALLDGKALEPLLRLLALNIDRRGIVAPLLRVFGNIVAGNDRQADYLVQSNFLNDHIMYLLDFPSVRTISS